MKSLNLKCKYRMQVRFVNTECKSTLQLKSQYFLNSNGYANNKLELGCSKDEEQYAMD